MRKTLLFVLLCCIVSTLSAQVDVPILAKDLSVPYYLEQIDGDNYLLVTQKVKTPKVIYFPGGFSTSYTVHLTNADLSSITEIKDNPLMDKDGITFLHDDQANLIAICTKEESKPDRMEIMKFTINANGAISSDGEIATIPLANSDDPRYTVVSENKLSCAYIQLNRGQKDKLRDISVLSMDRNGSIIFSANVEIETNNNMLSFWQNIVTDDGTVYLLIRSYSTEKNVDRNEQIHLVRVTESRGGEVFTFDDFSLPPTLNAKGLVLKNGNVFISGYYAEIGKKEVRDYGQFCLIFDDKNEDFIDMKTELVEYKPKLTDLKIPFTGRIRELYEMENGNVIVIGEEYVHEIFSTSRGTSEYDYTGSLFISTFNSSGILVNNKRIERYLKGRLPSILALYYRAGDDLYTFYFDTIEREEKPEERVNSFYDSEDCAIMIYKFSNDGEIADKQMLLPEKEFYINRIIHGNGHEIYVGMDHINSRSYSKNSVAKITLP